MPAQKVEDTLRPILVFLRTVGLSVTIGEVNDGTFLPGIEVANGGLIVNPSKLKYPGDLLHEAGHLAVTPARYRGGLSGEVQTPESVAELIELEAILWSYAACLHIGIDPRVVFHENGYHGQSEALLLSFSVGVYPGVQGLERAGMAMSRSDAALQGGEPFPVMLKWLKD